MPHRALTAVALGLAMTGPANAQPTGYFDVSTATVAALGAEWVRRMDGHRVLYLCTATDRCPPPTAIEIKGVVRVEQLPAAFDTGPLSPPQLLAAGRANAQRTGSEFMTATPVSVGDHRGVHMEAAATIGDRRIYFVTRWIGSGNRLLDVKVTAHDLAWARKLSDDVTKAVAPSLLP